jgi:hypothetical protein
LQALTSFRTHFSRLRTDRAVFVVKNQVFSIVVAMLLSLAWPFSVAIAQPANFSQPEILGSKQGLPQGFIPAIVQDSRGFIWIATRDGLCRFDGHKCKVYQPEEGAGPSLSSLGLEGMRAGPDNKIWIVTDHGNLDIFDPLKETFINYSKQPFLPEGIW